PPPQRKGPAAPFPGRRGLSASRPGRTGEPGRLLRHVLDRVVGRAAAEVGPEHRPRILLVARRDAGDRLVVEVPQDHHAHPRPAVAADLEGAHDVRRLLLLAGERAVLVAVGGGQALAGVPAELGEPDLLGRVAVALHHRALVLHAPEVEVGRVAPAPALLIGELRRAVAAARV